MMLFTVAFIIFLHTCLVWVWYRRTNNPSVVDVGWASGLTIAGLAYLISTGLTTRSMILGVALIAWGFRLGGYLWYTRIRLQHVDKRYTELSNNWTIAKPLGFFLNFQLQGLFIFIISIPWYFTSINSQSSLSLIDIAALTLFAVALFMESLSDLQLTQFKKKFPGKVCNHHLWHHSRHPNLFFDWLVWCSFTIFALSSSYGWVSVISPLCLYLIMTKVTIPMTEKGSIQSRGELYINYQRVTPMFFPRLR